MVINIASQQLTNNPLLLIFFEVSMLASPMHVQYDCETVKKPFFQMTVFKCKNLKEILVVTRIGLEKKGRMERKWVDIGLESAQPFLQPYSQKPQLNCGFEGCPPRAESVL